MYQSALVINDLVTAVLLFGQFSILRSRAVLVLASGYFFTAVMAFAHALTFPGLFASSGLLGAGPQTTAWLYMFWHGGFPLFVIVYSLVKSLPASDHAVPAYRAVLTSIGAVAVAAGTLVLLATAAHGALPPIMVGNRYTAAMATVVSTVWGLSLVALAVLWRRRPHSVLDVWLMVVMSAWLFDIALSAVLNAGRFDLGFYAGRLYGLLAATFVLVVLLLENGKLYARLAALHDEVAAHNVTLEETVRERTARLLQSEKVATIGVAPRGRRARAQQPTGRAHRPCAAAPRDNPGRGPLAASQEDLRGREPMCPDRPELSRARAAADSRAKERVGEPGHRGGNRAARL